MKQAIIIGVGPEDGLGAQLASRFAGSHQVIVSGRTESKLQACVDAIKQQGGEAEAVVADATSEADIQALFARAENLDLAIYNAGNNTPGKIAEMEADFFEASWRVCCFGGFLFGREAVRKMLPQGGGTLLFTGASASLRGRAGFGAFNSSKAGLRTLAQAMAKEYAQDHIHVGHVVVDGPIAGEKIKKGYPQYAEQLGDEGMINIQGIVDGFEFLYRQPETAWSFELDVRTFRERW